MARLTSQLAYDTIEQNGLLSAARWDVYKAVFQHGPVTSAEAYVCMGRTGKANLTQSRARFTELREAGVFAEVGERTCSVTGHKAIVWDVTDRLPGPIKKRKTASVRLQGYRALTERVAVWLEKSGDAQNANRLRERAQEIEG